MLSSAVFAQSEEKNAFNSKGKSFLSFSLSDLRLTLYDNDNTSPDIRYTMALSYGKFVTDRFAIGGSFKSGTYSRNVVFGNNTIRNVGNKLSLSGFARYYLAKKNGLFVEAEYEKTLLFKAWDSNGFVSDKFASKAGVSIGYSFLVGKSKRWAIEPKHTHFFSMEKQSRGVAHSSTFSIGITNYFGGKRKKKTIPTY